MTRGIGYYVHHHGAGHRHRARGIARVLDRPCTLIGTFGGSVTEEESCAVLDLPDDRLREAFDSLDGAQTRPLGLHYAPLCHPGIRVRMAAIAAWIARTDPVLMIVDVSVEVALLARLLSVPVLVMRLAGDRTDPPHLEAFRAAERLIAPFPEALDDARMPAWIRAKTIYAGFPTSRPAGMPAIAEDGRIVVLFGGGGDGGRLDALAAAARAVPERAWHVLGPVAGDRSALPLNLHLHGWVKDVSAHLGPAALVVAGAGDGALAEVAQAGKRFLCLPEPRPFGEQTAKAVALARLQAAIVHEGWPAEAAWPGLVARTLALDPSVMAGLAEPDAPARTAALIEEIANGLDARERPVS